MRRILFVISFLAVIMGLMQCRKPSFNFDEVAGGGQLHEMTFSASGDGEKGSFNEAFKYVWAAGDKIRVYATTDESGAFDATHGKYCGVLNLESGAGTTNATFYSSGIKLPDGTKKLRFMHYGSSLNVTDGAVEADFSTQTGAKAAVSEKLVAVFETAVNEKHRYSGAMEVQFAIIWLDLSSLSTSNNVSMVNVANNKLQVDKYGNVKKIPGNVVNLGNSNLNSYYLIVMDEMEKTYHTFVNESTGKCADLPSTFLKNKFYHGGSENSPAALKLTNLLPDGVLPGVMKISATEKVHFSKGNLYYGGGWHFEDNQWGYRTAWAENHVDHMYWSNYCLGIEKGYTKQDNPEWGENYCNTVSGCVLGDWDVLTKDEWDYLINKRTNAANLRKVVTFNISGNSICGLVLLPDGSTVSINSITTSDQLKTYNAVFLPAAGYRDGETFNYSYNYGAYWSKTNYDSSHAYSMNFERDNGFVYIYSGVGKNTACPVRLVSKKYQ